MITQNQIDQFYKDVDSLRLKFPVAAIHKATKESKGNISRYLKKQLTPSEEFLKKFYKGFKEMLGQSGDQSKVDIEMDRDKLIVEQQKEIIMLKAKMNIVLITLAEVVSKTDKKLSALVDGELTEAINRETKVLLDEFEKKSSEA